jgi:ubiquitin
MAQWDATHASVNRPGQDYLPELESQVDTGSETYSEERNHHVCPRREESDAEDEDLDNGLRRAKAKDMMVVHVKTLTGKTFTVKTSRKLPILYLKRQIKAQERIPKDHQRLIFAKKQLEDSRLLSDYSVNSDDTIYLVFRGSGD